MDENTVARYRLAIDALMCIMAVNTDKSSGRRMDTQSLANAAQLYEIQQDIETSFDGQMTLVVSAGKLKATITLETIPASVN